MVLRLNKSNSNNNTGASLRRAASRAHRVSAVAATTTRTRTMTAQFVPNDPDPESYCWRHPHQSSCPVTPALHQVAFITVQLAPMTRMKMMMRRRRRKGPFVRGDRVTDHHGCRQRHRQRPVAIRAVHAILPNRQNAAPVRTKCRSRPARLRWNRHRKIRQTEGEAAPEVCDGATTNATLQKLHKKQPSLICWPWKTIRRDCLQPVANIHKRVEVNDRRKAEAAIDHNRNRGETRPLDCP
jgi:hypothetical protein